MDTSDTAFVAVLAIGALVVLVLVLFGALSVLGTFDPSPSEDPGPGFMMTETPEGSPARPPTGTSDDQGTNGTETEGTDEAAVAVETGRDGRGDSE
ncbi:hypothetical protein ACFPYI_15350 [Halomarina salina]|uniref:Uncharacterized protein n=1 Tax=Halomarina salina TaxID=1872699 RepID=A0ABD5RPY0_9EURY|nr:hypothetical protein [Halomarina salina]